MVLLGVVTGCVASMIPTDRWSLVEAVCAPVLIDLIPKAGVEEDYYVSLDGQDPSDSYLSHLITLARSGRRSENMRKHSQLKPDQAAQPLLRAVNVACGHLRGGAHGVARVSGSGLIAPMPGQAFALGGHGFDYVLERRDDVWVIIRREGFWVS